ncbi:MAG: TonB family protein, partial [Bacteroidota bacterium]
LQTTPKVQYGQLLLKQLQSGFSIALANNFNHSQLKKRFKMMMKNKSNRKALLRYLLLVPLALCLLLTLSVANEHTLLEWPEKRMPNEQMMINIDSLPEGQTAFYEVDQMPLFPGCDLDKGAASLKDCSTEKLMEFIYTNIKYPKAARRANVQGTVVARFIVDQNGKVVHPEIVKSIDENCDEAVLAVVRQMPTWIPGEKDGEKVNVYFNLPIRFKLDDDQTLTEAPEPDQALPNAISKLHVIGHVPDLKVHQKVDQMPLYGDCWNLNDAQERQLCSQKTMLQFIYEALHYPKAAAKANIEGTVVVKFVIDQKGKVVKPEIVQSIGGGCDKEVLRVVQMMEDWHPGQHQGTAVAVAMTLPIKFKLESKAKAQAKTTQLVLKGFTAAPNPSSGTLRLEFDGPQGPTTLEVYDVNGKMASTRQFEMNGPLTQQIDLNGLAKGPVFIKVSQQEKVFTEKVIYQ